MRTMSSASRFASTGLQVFAIVVVAGLLLGQGCPAPAPSDGGGGDTTPPASPYLGAAGSDGCQLCHSGHYTSWLQTGHAKAFDTLKAIGQDKNPDCIECHTVGFGETGGFVDEATTPRLAGVQCESCHGAAADHRANVDDDGKRPPKSINSAVCGRCHNNAHHPTYDEWASTAHAKTDDHPFDSFAAGTSLNRCGTCHSGDYREMTLVEGLTVADSALKNRPLDEMNAVTCVTCHDPHRATGNNAPSDKTEDYQLRFTEVAFPSQNNSVPDATNIYSWQAYTDRLNLCSQCHHSREATWQATSRGPHASVQGSFYYGEMPVPTGTAPIVPNTNSVHLFVPKQCVSCHMQTDEFESDESPADSGHTFELKTTGCSAIGCHPSVADAVARTDAIQTEIKNGLAAIAARLGDPSTWEYSAEGGGPTSATAQAAIPDEIKKVRYMYHYMINEDSYGVHNPGYSRAMLVQMDVLLKQVSK